MLSFRFLPLYFLSYMVLYSYNKNKHCYDKKIHFYHFHRVNYFIYSLAVFCVTLRGRPPLFHIFHHLIRSQRYLLSSWHASSSFLSCYVCYTGVRNIPDTRARSHTSCTSLSTTMKFLSRATPYRNDRGIKLIGNGNDVYEQQWGEVTFGLWWCGGRAKWGRWASVEQAGRRHTGRGWGGEQ